MLIDINRKMKLYRDIFSDRGDEFSSDPLVIQKEVRVDPREEIEKLASSLMFEINRYRLGVDEESEDNEEGKFEKEYISPYVTARDKALRDKTKYVQTIDDLTFEYDWNLLSYDNYNTYAQDPETYDFDFDLNKYKNVRGVVVDTTQDLGVVKESECELVTVKFLPKPYRYKNGIYYTENEMNLLASYRVATSVYDGKGRSNPLIGKDEAFDYIQKEMDKYYAYLDFCERHDIAPEWRDVHRHYGVWFSEPIITYDIWEEYATMEDDDVAEVMLDSIFSGDYFYMKRLEIERVRENMIGEDAAYRAYERHKNIYPIETYHGSFFEEDERFEMAYGYDQRDGIIIDQEHELGQLLEVEHDVDNSVSCSLEDLVEYSTRDNEVEKKMEELDREIDKTRHIMETEKDIEFYKDLEFKREIKERGIDKIEDPKIKAIRAIETRFDVELGVETHIRPVVEKLNMMRFKPPVDRASIDWQNKYVSRSLDGNSSYEDLIKWRTGKFDERAKDTLNRLHDSLAESFSNIMSGGIEINSVDKENARNLGLGSSEFDALLGMGPSQIDIDASRIFSEHMKEESIAERVRKAQYTEAEMDSLGFSLGPDESDAGAMYARMTREELLDIPCTPWE